MPVVNIASVRSLSEPELDQVGRLAVTLSGQLTRVSNTEIEPAIAVALQHLAATAKVDVCQLIEFSESGTVARVYAPTSGAGTEDLQLPWPVCKEWLVPQLSRGDVVSISRPDDLPMKALTSSNEPRPAGITSLLGVPVSVAGRTVCALVLANDGVSRRWAPSLVDQLQLIAELLGTAVQRRRHDSALRAGIAEIERLNARLEADNVYLKEEIKSYHDFDEIVGDSAPLRLALSRVAQVAPTNSSVLLLGPTGTGKELFAWALHERSRRHARPLVRVNCAALPPTLVESELFGHEKGAFTGAVGVRQGRFEVADGGTIFLDEIGDLTPDIQVKFLRVLQEGEFERVGSSRTKKVDVRVIAATHHNLEQAVAEGRFRADLYYRLNVYPIHLPALRDRVDDIPRLVWFFIHRHQRQLGRHITKVPQALMTQLQQYAWPGNIRELENVVERAMIASTGDTLQLDAPLAAGSARQAEAGGTENLEAIQRAHIELVLDRCGGRINGRGHAAERLGVHPNTLRFRIKKLGIVLPDSRARRPAPSPEAARA